MNIVASAPGKLVLLGEYAVLEGAPAISMAVDRRVVVRVQACVDARCEVRAPDILAAPVPFIIARAGHPDWQQAGAAADRLDLVDRVLRALADAHMGPPPGRGLRLAIDSHAFFEASAGEPHKLGLGSSAAVTVALASAVAAYGGHAAVADERSVWLRHLLAMHRGFQGGHGSGVDVATSLFGGVVAYRLDAVGRSPQIRDLVWPAAVERLCVWSGKSASTPNLLARLRHWRTTHPAEYTARMRALAAIAETAVGALEGADGAGFIDAVVAYGDGLRTLDDASGIGIYSPEHRRIAELAERAGVVYKPCGAGGGDVGVGFARADPERLAALRSRLVNAGFACVRAGMDETGLKFDMTEIARA